MNEVINIENICNLNSPEFNPELTKIQAFVNQVIEVTKIEKVKSIVHNDETRTTVKFDFKDANLTEHSVTTSAKYLVNQLLHILEAIPELGNENCNKIIRGRLVADHVCGKYRNFRLIAA